MKVGYASAAIKWRAEHEQIAAGEELHAVTPLEQMNEAIQEARGLKYYIQRGRDRIYEWSNQLHERAELAAQSMSSFVQGAARAMRSGLHVSSGDGFDALPALDQLPRREQTAVIELDQAGQGGRDRSRSGNDSAGTSRISTSGSSVRPVLRSRQRSGAARG
ncbi:hypothetical protein U1708_19315 [Sphingomonas sp. ZB1N12]|uniref:hypothetical protein n=1 Tax=Sphingomonas arabinosi TaxID=3096160 RepID=UPI002FC67DE7